MADIPRHYWDTCVFLALVKNEKGRAEQCKKLWDDVATGKLRIVTSSLTFLETWGGPAYAKDGKFHETVSEFLMNEGIQIVPADQIVCQQAAQLRRWCHLQGHVVRPIDTIHIASALRAELKTFSTYDDVHLTPLNKLFPLDGNNKGELEIAKPKWVGQLPLADLA